MEVGSLSREVILWITALNLYPLYYRAAFAFSILPYPQRLGLALRFAFSMGELIPIRESYGLYHVSSECQSGLGLASPPVAHRLRRMS